MNPRAIAAGLLVAALSLPQFAMANGNENSFCRGYIIKALAEFPIDGLSRVDLWLGWNAVAERTGSQGMLSDAEYQAGRAAFDEMFAAGNSAAIIEMRDERCAMGRSPGWVWW